MNFRDGNLERKEEVLRLIGEHDKLAKTVKGYTREC